MVQIARIFTKAQALKAVLAVLLFSHLWLLNPAHAAVRMDVFLGYDGILPDASWFPVTFEIANDGPAFNAVVELSPSQYDRGQIHTMSLELPTGTTKRFVLPVFSAGRLALAWDARLLDEKGKVRAEAPGVRARKLNPWNIPLLAAVTRTAPSLPDLKARSEDLQPVVARILPGLFPDNPITLEGLDTVYLSSEKALDLKVGQVNALLAWLHAGGHLVVGIEQTLQVTGNEWLRRLLPCELTGMSTLTNHAALQEWVIGERQRNDPVLPSRDNSGPAAGNAVNPFAGLAPDSVFEQAPMQAATGSPRDGAVLIGSPENPLAIIAQRGRGQLTVLLFSPELEPFVSWKNRPHFWAKMAALPPELFASDEYNRFGAQSSDGIFGAMIDSKQIRKLPVGKLLLLLIGYLAVIGPLDHYWLKKINRQMLTWVTFPCYVALFSVLIYFIGYKLRAGETEWNELSVVDVLPVAGDQADLRGRTYVSVYSPVSASYRVASELPFAALRREYMGHYAGMEIGRTAVEQRGNNFTAKIAVPVWTSQLYVHDWRQRDEAPVKVTVSARGERWQVEVENRLDRKLHPAKLILDGRVLDLGEVPARETKKVSLAPSDVTLDSFVGSYGQAFFNAASQRQLAFGRNRAFINDVPQSAMAASFLGRLNARPELDQRGRFITPPGLELSPLLDQGGAIFLGWTPEFSPVKPIHQFSPRRVHRHTLWRLAVPVER